MASVIGLHIEIDVMGGYFGVICSTVVIAGKCINLSAPNSSSRCFSLDSYTGIDSYTGTCS